MRDEEKKGREKREGKDVTLEKYGKSCMLFVVVLFWASSQLMGLGTFNTDTEREGKPGMWRSEDKSWTWKLKKEEPKKGE